MCIRDSNYYYDSFENVEELATRTIGGVEMAGRTYKNVGMWLSLIHI